MKKVLIVLAVLLLLYGINVYMTDYYYKKPKYTLGIKNDTSALLRNANLKLHPEGGFGYGSCASGQEKWFMDPDWPMAEKIDVTFTDDVGSSCSLSLVTGLPRNYNGKILVIITKTNGNYALKLETNK